MFLAGAKFVIILDMSFLFFIFKILILIIIIFIYCLEWSPALGESNAVQIKT